MSREVADLYALPDAVHDEATFIGFVQALADDFALEQKLEAAQPSQPYSSGALGWEHSRIDDFLDAAAAWAGSNLQSGRIPCSNPWQRCAQILLAGKLHE